MPVHYAKIKDKRTGRRRRLHRITAPTLVLSGKYDEATPEVVQPFMDHISGAEWVIFEASSHMPHVEERELCMKTVNDFLGRAIS